VVELNAHELIGDLPHPLAKPPEERRNTRGIKGKNGLLLLAFQAAPAAACCAAAAGRKTQSC